MQVPLTVAFPHGVGSEAFGLRTIKNVFRETDKPSVSFLLGATLEIITDKSQEGAQFCKGFGGVGGKHCEIFHFFSNVGGYVSSIFEQ